jgi:hypothetical protein
MSSGNTLFYPAAIWVDNMQLTDQGRSPIVVNREERSTTVDLANGTKKKYIRSIKHKFATSWKYLPDDSTCTIDGYAARVEMYNLLGESKDSHTLRFFHRNGEYNEYTVFVDAYSETLTRRDPNTGIFIWELSLSFEES